MKKKHPISPKLSDLVITKDVSMEHLNGCRMPGSVPFIPVYAAHLSHCCFGCTEYEHTRADILFHLSAHYIFLFMECTAVSDMTVHPFLTLRVAETSVL